MNLATARAGAPAASDSLDDWLRWQEAVHPRAIELGLDRVSAVAARMGLPWHGARTITVAGTNGKGSSTVLLSEIYRAAGYRVGAYTSPHLRRYNERIAVDGMPASDADLCAMFAEIERARGDTLLTYFEFGTLAALRLFREARVQVQVLEVGLGGRLDAVNLVDADAAALTNIGLDHQDYLGTTREQIGREKAGIFRRGRPAVSADPDPPRSIAECAAETGAPLLQLARDYDYRVVADAWSWQGQGARYHKLPPPALSGPAQLRNAAGVLAVVTALQELLPVDESAIRSGLVRLDLPGRFERRGRVILDVAHNMEAAQVLAENLHTLRADGACRIVLGMLSDKPVEAFCAALAPQAVKVYAGGLPPPRGLAGADLARRAASAGVPVEGFDSVADAFARAKAESQPGEWLVACGSFLTVAAVAERLA